MAHVKRIDSTSHPEYLLCIDSLSEEKRRETEKCAEGLEFLLKQALRYLEDYRSADQNVAKMCGTLHYAGDAIQEAIPKLLAMHQPKTKRG